MVFWGRVQSYLQTQGVTGMSMGFSVRIPIAETLRFGPTHSRSFGKLRLGLEKNAESTIHGPGIYVPYMDSSGLLSLRIQAPP